MANRGSLRPPLSRGMLSLIVAVGIALTGLTVVASWSALCSHRRAFPGLFIDPHASFSEVWWPAWGAERPPMRFPDRLVAIDGEPVREKTRFELPAQAIAERLETLRARGDREARLPFATDGGPRTIARPLRPRGADEALFYFGLYTLVGLFVLWSGLAVLVLARRRAGAVGYAAWSVGTFVFMVTFYDYHSAAWLAPLFSLSTVSFPIFVIWLAYSFPEPPLARRRAIRAVVIAFTACAVGAAGVLALGPYVSFPERLDLRALRSVVVAVALSSLLVLSISILLRLRVERGRRRQELRSSALGLAAV